MYADELLRPRYEQTPSLTDPLAPRYAHTHIGVNDPDTFTCTAKRLPGALAVTG